MRPPPIADRDKPSDHFDGARFFNPGVPQASHGLVSVLRWRLKGRRTRWPERVENEPFPPLPPEVAPGMAAICFVNHATFLIRLPGVTVLTDPIFGDRCSPLTWAGPRRARAPGVALADLPRPDLVLISHNHYDHMDIPSLRAIQRLHAPRFVTMLGNAVALAGIGIVATELDWWQSVTVGNLQVTATPARHFSARTPFDRNRTLWGGFMIRAAEGQFLFAGDSGAGPHWREIAVRLGAPAVALLPIGAYEPRWLMAPIHMDPAEAVQAHQDLRAGWSIGMHFGTFQLTDEAIDAPVLAMQAARQAAGLAEDAFIALGFGETRVFRLAGA